MPRSLPALAAGILQSNQAWRVQSDAARLDSEPLPPVYYTESTLSATTEAERVAQTVSELAQRLARLPHAYHAWPVFHAGAYFDLYHGQMAALSRVEETRRIVRVRLYADLLAPALRSAERYWVETFLPAYHAGAAADAADAFRQHLYDEAVPTLAARLEQAITVVQGALDRVTQDVTVLGVLGGLEERIQHRPRPGTRVADGLPVVLQRLPRTMPTLTLDLTFPAPLERPLGREVWLRFEQTQT